MMGSSQRSALLQFYVRHLHAFLPVVDFSHLRSLCHDDYEQPLPPLQCAVFAQLHSTART